MEKMTAMLKDESTRKKFVDDSVDFLKKFEFDGLDLDFECNTICARSKQLHQSN